MMYLPPLAKHTTIEPLLNKVHHCRAEDLLYAIPTGSVDLIVTSPPYNLGMKGKNLAGSKWNPKLTEGYEDYDDNMPHDKYVHWQRSILAECMRVIPDNGAIFYNHKWRIQNGLLDMRNDIVSGFPIRQVIVWRRSGGHNFNKGYFLPTFEVVYLIVKPEFELVPGANKYGDVWEITQEQNNSHPAPFPVTFAERCILSTSAKTILDPFMGSGTVALAAVKNGRSFIGCDHSRKYVDMANERLNQPRTMNMFEVA